MGASGVDFEIHRSALSCLWAPAESISKLMNLNFASYGHQRRRFLYPYLKQIWVIRTSGVDFEIHSSDLSGLWAPATPVVEIHLS
jgi:hypothetical protein